MNPNKRPSITHSVEPPLSFSAFFHKASRTGLLREHLYTSVRFLVPRSENSYTANTRGGRTQVNAPRRNQSLRRPKLTHECKDSRIHSLRKICKVELVLGTPTDELLTLYTPKPVDTPQSE